MAKRIYIGLEDRKKAAEVARQTEIGLDRLLQAAAGKLKLSAAEHEKVNRALKGRR